MSFTSTSDSSSTAGIKTPTSIATDATNDYMDIWGLRGRPGKEKKKKKKCRSYELPRELNDGPKEDVVEHAQIGEIGDRYSTDSIMREEEVVQRVSEALKEWDSRQSALLAGHLATLNLEGDENDANKYFSLIKKRNADRITVVTKLVRFLSQPPLRGEAGLDPAAEKAGIDAIIMSTTNNDLGSTTGIDSLTAPRSNRFSPSAKKGVIPSPGKEFIITDTSFEHALAVQYGQLKFVNLASVSYEAGAVWMMAEAECWSGFRNTVTGTYLGVDSYHGTLQALSDSQGNFQRFCVQQEASGKGYVLLVSYGDGLRRISAKTGDDDTFGITEQMENQMVWAFVEV